MKKKNSKNISKEEKLMQVKSKVDFMNLKSDYFLLKLFDIMKKNKSLKIIKNILNYIHL